MDYDIPSDRTKSAIPIFTAVERVHSENMFLSKRHDSICATGESSHSRKHHNVNGTVHAVTQFNHPARDPYLINVLGCQLYLVQAPYDLQFVAKILKNPPYLRVIYTRTGADTYRHLVLLDDDVARLVRSEKWPLVLIRPYRIDKQRNLPKEREMSSLYVRIPADKPTDGDTDWYDQTVQIEQSLDHKHFLNERLNVYAQYKVIPTSSWKINNRSPGAFIIQFDRAVDMYRRALVRILLDNEICQNTKIRCSWQRL